MKYVIWKCFGDYMLTNEENYNRRIQNAREVKTLRGFDSAEEVIDYCTTYLKIDKDDIIAK